MILKEKIKLLNLQSKSSTKQIYHERLFTMFCDVTSTVDTSVAPFISF